MIIWPRYGCHQSHFGRKIYYVLREVIFKTTEKKLRFSFEIALRVIIIETLFTIYESFFCQMITPAIFAIKATTGQVDKLDGNEAHAIISGHDYHDKKK